LLIKSNNDVSGTLTRNIGDGLLDCADMDGELDLLLKVSDYSLSLKASGAGQKCH
jgi:hypothetical protein